MRSAELAEHDCVVLEPYSGNRLLIHHGLAHVTAKPRWTCKVQHVPTQFSLIEAGAGIGAVNRMDPNNVALLSG